MMSFEDIAPKVFIFDNIGSHLYIQRTILGASPWRPWLRLLGFCWTTCLDALLASAAILLCGAAPGSRLRLQESKLLRVVCLWTLFQLLSILLSPCPRSSFLRGNSCASLTVLLLSVWLLALDLAALLACCCRATPPPASPNWRCLARRSSGCRCSWIFPRRPEINWFQWW